MKTFTLTATIFFLLFINSDQNQSGNGEACSVSKVSNFPTSNDLKNRVVYSTGDSAVDKYIVDDLKKISKLTNIKPSFRLYNDGPYPNALAINQSLFKNRVTILLGTTLVKRSLNLSELTVDGKVVGKASYASHISLVMMHEFAHLAQFRYETIGPTRDKELQADMLAGWYIAQRIEGIASESILHGVKDLYSYGDYKFFDPNHHGTPEERVNAFWYGYQLYKKGTENFWDAFEHTFVKMNLKEG